MWFTFFNCGYIHNRWQDERQVLRTKNEFEVNSIMFFWRSTKNVFQNMFNIECSKLSIIHWNFWEIFKYVAAIVNFIFLQTNRNNISHFTGYSVRSKGRKGGGCWVQNRVRGVVQREGGYPFKDSLIYTPYF